jgi:hypothetical protein
MTVATASLIVTTAALVADRWLIAEVSYLALFLVLLQFAVRRFLGAAASRRPPAAFVLIPLGVLHGVAGAIMIIARMRFDASPWTASLGALLIEQGVFLCFTVGIGGLILPLIGGSPPPADLGSSPRETARAVAYFAAGLAIFLSLLIEHLGAARLGPTLRACVVAVGLGVGGGAWRMPGKPGLHRQLVWLAIWLMPAGLLASALWPDYRVPALHVVFIGGFGMLAFAVATHVILSHLDVQQDALGRPPAVIALATGILVAMAARVAADWSDTYFAHLGWAAAAWIAASAIWLAYVGPKLLRR